MLIELKKYLLLMYSILIAQIKSGGRRDLVLVLEGDLYLVPFSVLRPGPGFSLPNNASQNQNSQGNNAQNNSGTQNIADITEYLCERYSLISVPSLSALKGYKVNKSKAHNDPHQSGI